MNYRFMLVKHKKFISNYNNYLIGWSNVPLSLNDIDVSNEIGSSLIKNNLLPTVIFCSELDRSQYSSYIIKNKIKKNITIHKTWRLNDKNYGSLEGININKLEEKYGSDFIKLLEKNFNFKPPIKKKYLFYNCYPCDNSHIGESLKEVQDRLLYYYNNNILSNLKNNELPLIVTYNHTMRVLMKYLLNINDEEFENYYIPDNKILIIDLDKNYNYIKHKEINY